MFFKFDGVATDICRRWVVGFDQVGKSLPENQRTALRIVPGDVGLRGGLLRAPGAVGAADPEMKGLLADLMLGLLVIYANPLAFKPLLQQFGYLSFMMLFA